MSLTSTAHIIKLGAGAHGIVIIAGDGLGCRMWPEDVAITGSWPHVVTDHGATKKELTPLRHSGSGLAWPGLLAGHM